MVEIKGNLDSVDDSSIEDFKSSPTTPTPSRMSRLRGIPVSNRYQRDNDDRTVDEVVVSTRVQWAKNGPTSFKSVGKTIKSIPSGVYNILNINGETIFDKNQINVDLLIDFPDSKTDKILKEVDDFWKTADLFDKHGFLHRRGYLLYGPPGGGKTSLVQQIIKKIIENKGIVFMCGNPSTTSEGLKIFREVEPERNAVCVFEDIDAIIDQYGEDELLSMLDGENQIDKVINIATTNYPEKLDKRLVNRPRRFDRVIKINTPTAEIRRIYFKDKLKIEDSELEMWVKSTDNFSFAAMAELVISVKCLNNPFDKAVETLRKLMTSKPSSTQSGDETDEPGKMGFFPVGRK